MMAVICLSFPCLDLSPEQWTEEALKWQEEVHGIDDPYHDLDVKRSKVKVTKPINAETCAISNKRGSL